jgi:hypothetical protein
MAGYITSLHTLYAVDACSATGGAMITGIRDFNVDTAITEALNGSDGLVDPTFVTIDSQMPVISFTSTDIATVLDVIGISGLAIPITVELTDDYLDAFFMSKDEGATNYATSVHTMLTVNKGLIIPRTINASNTPPATISCDVIATYDGTNDPVVIATSQALADGAGMTTNFVCGKVSLNGAAVTSIESITIDFGIKVNPQRGGGDVWPSFVTIWERIPSITFTTTDVSQLNTLTLPGVAQAATDSIVYLRKCSAGGARVANGTSEHISFSIAQGHLQVSTIGGSHGAPLMAQLKITPSDNQSDSILAIDTTAAIV